MRSVRIGHPEYGKFGEHLIGHGTAPVLAGEPWQGVYNSLNSWKSPAILVDAPGKFYY